MKKLRLLFAFLFSILWLQVSYSQDLFRLLEKEHPNATLGEIIKAANAYFELNGKAQNEAGEGEYYQYKRWEYELKRRFRDDEIPTDYHQANFEEFHKYKRQLARQNAESKSMNNTSANWKLYGPSKLIYPSSISGMGRVNVIAVDPSNSSIIYIGTPAGGLWRTLDGGSTWSPLTDGMPQIGVSGIVIDPTSPIGNRKIYLLTGDGNARAIYSNFLVSSDNGNSWASSSSFSSSWGYKLIQHPTNYNLFAVTHTGIQRSFDNGLTWMIIQTGFFVDIEFHPTNPLIAYASTTDGKFYRSSNGGINWTQISSGLPIMSERVAIGITANMPDRVYVLHGDGKINRSDDAGLTFNFTTTTPMPSTQTYYNLAIGVSPTDGNVLHVGGFSGHKSINGGVSWTFEGVTHADIHDYKFIDSFLLCANDGGIYKSTNNGISYTFIGQGVAITQFYRIHGDPNLPNFLLGGTQDNGTNLINRDSLLQVLGADGMECFIDPNLYVDPSANPLYSKSNILYATVQGGGLYRILYPYGIGTAFSIIPINSLGNWITPFCMDPNNQNIIYAGYKDVYKSVNRGSTWTNITNGQINGILNINNCYQLAIAPSNSNIIFAYKGTVDQFYKTTDGGITWLKLSNTPVSFINSIVIHPTNPQRIWIAGIKFSNSNNTVFESNDGGQTWMNKTGSLPNLSPTAMIYQKNSSKNRIYLGMDVGVYYIDDDHSDWQLFDDGLPNTIMNDFDINYNANLLRVGTYGRGIWETELICDQALNKSLTGLLDGTEFHSGLSITSSNTNFGPNSNVNFKCKDFIKLSEPFEVKSNQNVVFRTYLTDNLCPQNVSASRNQITGTYIGPMPGAINLLSTDVSKSNYEGGFDLFPNPAKDLANIEFVIEDKSNIEIVIYNLEGIQMGDKTKVNDLEKGKYEFNLNTSNLASGNYFIALKMNDTVFKKKLIVVK
jgi:photosystem II stability/assembly factor-like uncharacterized protein